jgi:uncharacterized protein (TIGR02594 family)
MKRLGAPLLWGLKLNLPAPGCVVVFSREGGGHVGFVVGKDVEGNLLVLGGNQGDEVNIKAFGVDRVSGYRWPDSEQLPSSNLALDKAVLSVRES